MSLILMGALAAASSIANGVFGGWSANKQKQAQLAANAKAAQESRNWYNRRMNEDATARADAQRTLTRANEAIRKRTQAAAGKRAVIGGTGASEAAVQQANAEAMGNAVSGIVANADARKDAIEQRYRAEQSELNKERSNINAQAEAARRNAMAQAATGVVNTAASVIGSSDYFDLAQSARQGVGSLKKQTKKLKELGAPVIGAPGSIEDNLYG